VVAAFGEQANPQADAQTNTQENMGVNSLGMTINSFASVSLAPPLILWSVQCDATHAQRFVQAPRFTISVLGGAQESVAQHFAGNSVDNFADLTPLKPEWPGIVAGARAWFFCQRWAVYPGGDHDIIVGEVIDFQHDPGDVLTFLNGRFGRAEN
jgi:flavin reductase (DIM6/NTAB) family NADH-FMN oxidoreductase RutF